MNSYLIYGVVLTLIYKIGSFIIRKRYKEPSFVGFRVRRPVEAFKIVKIVAVIGFLGIILWASGCFGLTIFETDFETYDVGALVGQDGWTDIGDGSYFQITSTSTISGVRSIQVLDKTGAWTGVKKTGVGVADGKICFKFETDLINGTGQAQIELMEGAGYRVIISMPPLIAGNNKFKYHDGASYVDFGTENYEQDRTYIICTEWRTSDNMARYQIDCGDWTEWDTAMAGFEDIDVFRIQSAHSALRHNFFDDIAEDLCEEEEPEFRIWGTDPVSTTEISATSTEFTFQYEGFASSSWSGIIVNFCEEITGICADEAKFPKSELSGTSGQETLYFDNFNFEANGHYDLIGDAYFGMFNSAWEWVEGFTGDVVSPQYYVMINFEGLPEIFQVEVPEDWYSEHSEYATSTTFFSTITGILTPLFSKIGDFGSRISGFFDQNEAYSRGNNIGAILPTFKLYIEQFSFLFGGFPLIETFILAMVVMMGFFLFKLVFRTVRG